MGTEVFLHFLITLCGSKNGKTLAKTWGFKKNVIAFFFIHRNYLVQKLTLKYGSLSEYCKFLN